MKLEERDVESGKTHVRWVRLDRFRNYQTLEVELGSRFNLISGRNGQGKTNFLEALHLVATTRLLRGQREVEAIYENEEKASVAIELEPSQTLLSLEIERGARKRVMINGLKLPRASDVIGRLACVCISSEDMEIVRGDPSERRLFLDLELSARSPAYLRHFSVYKRALEQRNALLKQARESSVSRELWEVWEEQLVEHGISIRELRSQFVGEVAEVLPSLHRRIGAGESASCQIVCKEDFPDLATGLRVYAESRNSDIARGSTTIGPHRDDVEFVVGGRSARLYGSQGQQRTVVLALKMATLLLGRRLRGEPPLLLLDDIFSDLDVQRRSALVEIVLEMAGQTVLTCTEADAAGPKILHNSDIFFVERGKMSKAS